MLVLGGVEEDMVEFAPLLDGVKSLVLLGEVLVKDNELLELIVFGFLFWLRLFVRFVSRMHGGFG